MKKRKNFPIITFSIALIVLSGAYYFYVNITEKESAVAAYIGNLKSSGMISSDYVTEFEKEEIEKKKLKEKEKEEKRIKEEQEIKKKKEQIEKEIEAQKKLEAKKKEEEAKRLAKLKEEAEKNKKQKDIENNILPEKVILDVPNISQLPDLKNGCEITSTTMMLQYSGVKVDKMTLANDIKKDPTKITYDDNGNILEWGDPDYGFVGDITGIHEGYSVNPKPIIDLIKKYIKPKDLTNKDYREIEKSIALEKPVVVWITVDFSNPSQDRTWKKDNKVIDGHFNQHSIIVTGYDSKYVYYNDPLKEEKNLKVDKSKFKQCWESMGRKAITYF